MKKLLGFVFLILLLSSNAHSKEIQITNKDENSISITRSIWTEAEMFKIAAEHCGKYKKYAFTFGVFNKKGVPDNKGNPTRLYHCSKKYLAKSPLTGDGNLHWTSYKSDIKIEEKKLIEAEKPIKVTKNMSAEKKYYWCEKHDYPSKGLSMMIPIEVDENITKVEFMKSVRVNGIDEQSSYSRHIFTMQADWKDFYKTSKGYPFKGRWGKGGPVKGVIYNDHYSGGSYLVFTIDRVGTFEYPCQRLK